MMEEVERQVLTNAQPAVQPASWGGPEVRKALSKGDGEMGKHRRGGDSWGTGTHQLRGQGCPWLLCLHGHITAGMAQGQRSVQRRRCHPHPTRGTPAGPHFSQVLRERSDHFLGYKLNQGSRTAFEDA